MTCNDGSVIQAYVFHFWLFINHVIVEEGQVIRVQAHLTVQYGEDKLELVVQCMPIIWVDFRVVKHFGQGYNQLSKTIHGLVVPSVRLYFSYS